MKASIIDLGYNSIKLVNYNIKKFRLSCLNLVKL